MIIEAINKLRKNQNLSEKQMKTVFMEIMSGSVDTETIANFLLLLKKKGETIEEITGAARIMRELVTKIDAPSVRLLDTCGTGGDEAGTFNISTVSAFVACGAGCTVAKHGNKAVSSKCGSADLLSQLGVNVNIENGSVERCINEAGIGFLFAPRLHLAMKYASGARKKIKTRSIFNILGPLTNPAGAKYQLLGVYNENLVVPLANVLRNLGSVRAMVVHGKDGLDEITTTGFTAIAELKNGKIKTYSIRPEGFGFKKSKKEDLKGQDAVFNAKVAMDILKGKKGLERDVVVINAGAAIYVTGIAGTMAEGIKMAAESIDSGRAFAKLEKLKKLTNDTF